MNLNFFSPVPLAGRRRAEVSPRMLHLSELPDVHRGRRHIRIGGEVEALLVSCFWGVFF